MTIDSVHFPVHWLVCNRGKTGSRYKRIAFAWALNFVFKDYCLLPAEFLTSSLLGIMRSIRLPFLGVCSTGLRARSGLIGSGL